MLRSLALIMILSWTTVQAQNFVISQNQVDFGDVMENSPDSVMIEITNQSAVDAKVTAIYTFGEYGWEAFDTSLDSFDLSQSSSESFWIRFNPIHNVRHNSEVLIVTDRRGTFTVDVLGDGRYSNNYYSTTFDLDEQSLKSSLKTKLSNMSNLSYNAARDEMYLTIDNKAVNGQGAPQNEVEGVYTGFTVSGFANRTAAQNMGVNTEHTFPQSFFNSQLPERADIHHLFITQANANSVRSNLPFGNVSNADWTMGGSQRGGGVFEPRDVQKGFTARAMMYFVVRYQDYSNFFAGQESLLRQWAEDFPPNARERKRNDDIETAQGNRNPFIDYPQFADRITSLSGNSQAPSQPSLFLPQSSIDFGDVVSGEFDFDVFSFVVMNDGNETVALSQFAISDTTKVRFADTLNGTVDLEPGESLTLRLLVVSNSVDPLSEMLTFDTDLASDPSFSIPITADVIASINDIPQLESGFQLFPNPGSDQLVLSFDQHVKDGKVRVVDALGKVISEVPFNGNRLEMETRSFPNGIYSVQVVVDQEVISRKWLKINGIN